MSKGKYKDPARFKCVVCGKVTAGRMPWGRDDNGDVARGDTTSRYPRRHKIKGKPCEGNIKEAEWIEIELPRVRALKILLKGPATPGMFASKMWPDSPGWKKIGKQSRGVRAGKQMARTGGAYLTRLRNLGLTELNILEKGVTYYLTAEGEEFLRKHKAV